MSAPQQPPQPKSPTPSKSSLRKTQGSSNSSQRNLLPSASPRFEEGTTTAVRYSPRSPPNQTLEYNSDEDDDEAAQDALIKGPLDDQEAFAHHEGSYFPVLPDPHDNTSRFEPLFTLIEDSVTLEHHHPSIYYVFADDDDEVITEAALRSLDDDEPSSSSASASTPANNSKQPIDEGHDHSNDTLPPAQAGVKEHYLILDLQPSDHTQPGQSEIQSQSRSLPHGPSDESLQQAHMQSQSTVRMPPFVVSSYTSLSPEWQVQSANISSAPTMSEAPTGADEGFMLRIEGRGFAHLGLSDVLAAATRGKKNAAPVAPGAGVIASDINDTATLREREGESLEEMVDRLQSNLNEIRKLIDVDLPFTTQAGSIGVEVVDVEEEPATHHQDQSFDFEAQD